jgi:SAM-dependent methyltransferase
MWTEVDRSDDPSFFVRFLEATRRPVVAAAAANPVAFFAYLDLHPGQRVLDAACGLGELTGLMASLVAPDGEAVGVDFSETMVDEARRRAEGRGLPVRFEQGDIMALSYPDHSFDCARAEQVLQHIPSPETAMTELTRVTKSGGIVAVLEPDWDTLIIDADDLATSRAFTAYNSTIMIPHGAIGRRLPALFRGAGLRDVTVTPTVLMPPYPPLRDFIESNTQRAVQDGVVAEGEARAWLDDLAARHTDGRFFAAFSYFCVTGRTS